MLKPMDKLIARRCFATLYLDFEYPGDDILPPVGYLSYSGRWLV